jgi:hypothetical protein
MVDVGAGDIFEKQKIIEYDPARAYIHHSKLGTIRIVEVGVN